MKIEKLKSNKAVTMTILVIIIIVLLIISSTIIVTTRNDEEVTQINSLYADVLLLRDKVLLYYNKYEELPIGQEVADFKNKISNYVPEEVSDNFYKIDLSKLEDLTLHYGNEKDDEGNTDLTDFYIVNERTLNVYYYPGILYDGETFYTY